MATLRHVATLALCTACVRNEPDLYSSFPEPIEVAGPPGGPIDRQWVSGSPDDGGGLYADASIEVTASAGLTTSCTDGEIDATLEGYGEWIEIEGYGLVWRPYTTAVGVDFTPYETCGSWVWTEWGWTFACEWDWGWLPFHYGRWGWFDDYWAWVPGYEWSPAWVEWREGGGYVGWRPLAPKVRDHRSTHAGGGGPIVRDHRSGPRVRDHRTGPRIRDHRTRVASTKDWQWRFTASHDLGKPRIRAHLYKSLAEGLRVTAAVTQPPTRASVRPVAAASIMHPRLAFAERARDARLSAPVHERPIDRRIGGRIELAPVAPGARLDRRSGVGGERPRAQSIDRGVYAPAQPSRPARAEALGASSDSLVTPTGGLEITPTTPTPSPEPRPATQHPLHVPDRAATQPPVASPPTTRPPIAHPPRGPERYNPPIAQPPIAQPPRSPERYNPPPPPSRAPDRMPPSSPPVSSAPPVSAPPTPPSRSSAPTYSPPVYSPPARSSPPTHSAPTYSSPRASTPTYSPPARSSPPSAGSSGSTRNHRR